MEAKAGSSWIRQHQAHRDAGLGDQREDPGSPAPSGPSPGRNAWRAGRRDQLSQKRAPKKRRQAPATPACSNETCMPARVKKTVRIAGSKSAKTESTRWSACRSDVGLDEAEEEAGEQGGDIEARSQSPVVRTSAAAAAVARRSGRTERTRLTEMKCIATATEPPMASATSKSSASGLAATRSPPRLADPGLPDPGWVARATSKRTMQAMLLSATAAIEGLDEDALGAGLLDEGDDDGRGRRRDGDRRRAGSIVG